MTRTIARETCRARRRVLQRVRAAAGAGSAPARLREAGLATSLRNVQVAPDIVVSDPVASRGPLAGFFNERALLEMIESVYERVRAALQATKQVSRPKT